MQFWAVPTADTSTLLDVLTATLGPSPKPTITHDWKRMLVMLAMTAPTHAEGEQLIVKLPTLLGKVWCTRAAMWMLDADSTARELDVRYHACSLHA